jgi:DNA-binding IclR family transcriptional regulator
MATPARTSSRISKLKMGRKSRAARPGNAPTSPKKGTHAQNDANPFRGWAAAHGLLSPLPFDDAGKDKQRSIQSIEVGFRLIRSLEMAPRLLSPKELAAAAGMSASKAHFYLVSFRKIGFVYRDEATGRYGLGPYAAQLGLLALNRMDVVALSKEPMQQLVARTGEAAFLSVWGNHGACIVSKVDGPRFIPMVLRVGYTLPLVDTATGRVFLAFMPQEATAAVLERERREKASRLRATSLAEIRSIVTNVRAKGLARNDSVVNEGFVAISAPIFDHSGLICAAMTLIGPSGLMNADRDGENERAMKETTNQVSRLLGSSAASHSSGA